MNKKRIFIVVILTLVVTAAPSGSVLKTVAYFVLLTFSAISLYQIWRGDDYTK